MSQARTIGIDCRITLLVQPSIVAARIRLLASVISRLIFESYPLGYKNHWVSEMLAFLLISMVIVSPHCRYVHC